jgi:hypothetical protein
MQETANMQWDLREPPPVSAITKLYFLFVLACCIWAAVVFIKRLWKSRSWPSTRRGNLIALSRALQAADATQASTLAADIPEASPEAGLRSLIALKSLAFHELPSDIIDRADLRFTYELSVLRATAANLKSLATLLLVITGAWTAYGLVNICEGISATPATGTSGVYGSLSEIFVGLCLSQVVLAILYILRWRIVTLLARRERLWNLLVAQLRILSIPPR